MYNSLLVRAYLRIPIAIGTRGLSTCLPAGRSVIYLLTLVLKHATNHTQSRYQTFPTQEKTY